MSFTDRSWQSASRHRFPQVFDTPASLEQINALVRCVSKGRLNVTVAKSTGQRPTHPNAPDIDQSDRLVPINLRQSGPTSVQMLISTRVRKSPFWHLSVEAGAWKATIYNRMYHPRAYVRPEDGGAMAEYDALVHRVTLWDVAVERQIRVQGPDAEDFVNFVITRDAARIEPMNGKYCIVCDEKGRILNDPVLLRLAPDEFWFSISDSDLMMWLKGVNSTNKWRVNIDEIDVAPLQIQGPLSEKLMCDIVGPELQDLPYYGMMEAQIGDAPVVISQTGFSGEKGYEVYVKDASRNAESVWYAIRGKGAGYGLRVTAPGHHRRIAAGILSWGQDMDHETSPFQVNLAYQVPKQKQSEYIGREELERQREIIESGGYPFNLKLVGMELAGRPITDYAPDFWLVRDERDDRVGYVTSAWWSPELEVNIALAYVPWRISGINTPLKVELPEAYCERAGKPVEARVCEVPFRPSAHASAREKRVEKTV